MRNRARAVREWIRSRRGGQLAYRTVVAALGAVLVLGGLVMVPFPGPGWLVVLLGLAVLASEFSWANRLKLLLRGLLAPWVTWLSAQAWPVRGVVGLATVAAVLGAGYLVLRWLGAPGWLPEGLVSWLPGL
jgi:uncharacterized protein (TIGR02611 family)